MIRAVRVKEQTGLRTAEGVCSVLGANGISIDLDEKSTSRDVLPAADRLHAAVLELPLSSSNLCVVCNSTNESTIIINIYKNYYVSTCFDTKMCHPQGASFVTCCNCTYVI